MRHQNSVFHDLLKRVPWSAFDRLVGEHGTDHRVRTLRTRDQFIALLYGQLSGAMSLREIVCGLQSHSARLYHLGARTVCRASLADANAKRNAAVFSDLLHIMMAQAGRRLRRDLAEATYLIDSSGLRLTGAGCDWARFSAGVHGAKVHVMYDADTECPVQVAVTAGVSDELCKSVMCGLDHMSTRMRSPNRISNWLRAGSHSLGAAFQPFSMLRMARNSSLLAA